ncbi:MAG TPA: multicopper oxidase domain-containing protein, partial [Gemmatimonadales bacterium]|nr:multicopper oxidase domain-containing protein [Gemmatimonadales bacterium]
MRIAAATGLLATVLVTANHPGVALQAGVGNTPPPVHPNDNRTPAGRLHSDTLELRLEARTGTWRPEADSGPAIEVAAFAEEGRAPEIPAPLVRVPAGTIIVASVRNALADSTITVHGLVSHPAARDDSLMLRPGESRTLTFLAGEAGTYAYWATLGTNLHRRGVDPEQEQLAGAFVVDPPGGSPPDRILVINVWGVRLDSSTYRHALTINGRSWPYTERLDAMVGDSVRWRVVNASRRGHPMHLHGFYFRLDALGDGLADSMLPPGQRPMVVTQSMTP